MATERRIFVRLAPSGAWEYGLYAVGGRARDRIFGTAPTRQEAAEALLAQLRRKLWWNNHAAALCLGVGVGLVIAPWIVEALFP